MEIYRRIVERVRGALWAHHRRLMPERQFHRILAYVYNNKYEFQIRFDRMEVVGHAFEGKVEVVTTPSGHLKRVRIHPCVEDLTPYQQQQLVLAAYGEACDKGHRLLAEAETQVYRQFLLDLKPIVLGIRDNPEFFTVPDSTMMRSRETIGGVQRVGEGSSGGGIICGIEPLSHASKGARSSDTPRDRASSSFSVSPFSSPFATAASATASPSFRHRTISAAKARLPADEVRARNVLQSRWIEKNTRWTRSLVGKEFLSRYAPQYRPRGAPGAKRGKEGNGSGDILPLDLPVPYIAMDEKRLQRRNWVAFLDNKHVAETLWTRTKIGDREKNIRQRQEMGQAWHHPIHEY